jgi:ribosome biogenesis GTPase / thiamine phosphate phosphatase
LSDLVTGTVVAVQANFYMVHLSTGRKLLCTKREKLKKIGATVIVGDAVTVSDWQGERGAIVSVAERRSELDRPPIANVDAVLLVFALAEPAIEPLTLSKFLVKAEGVGVNVQLCLNKSDLIAAEEQQMWVDRFTAWGYPPLLVSTHTTAGLDTLRQQLHNQITVLAGHSGVGKSSLIAALIPDLHLRVATVSGKLNRGRHTTRHVELFELPTGGLIADTPGFNQPDLHCTQIELAQYFPELRNQNFTCQFADCLHEDEPGCGLDRTWERYEHYRNFLAIAQQWQQQQAQQRQPENQFKQRHQAGAAATLEPRLAAKQYRRPSRRRQNQDLAEFTDLEFTDLDDPDADLNDLDP